MIVTQTVNVHLDKKTPVTVETVQSDSGRGIRFHLFSNGEEMEIKKGVTGIVRYSICHEGEYYTSCYDTLPDGSPAVVNYGNYLTVYLTPEIFSIVGVGELQVGMIYLGEVTTTMTVLLRVQRDLSMEGITPAVRTDLTRFIQEQVSNQIKDFTGFGKEQLKWYALGDGITQGYYSQFGGGGLSPDKSWAAVAASENGWQLTNLALSGAGYVQASLVDDRRNARDYVDTIDFSEAELVTLSYGVNDWMYNCPLGSMSDDVDTGGTLYSNMRYCIEKILMEQPGAKVVVISPINSSAYGTVQGNWGAGYAFAAGTLEDIYQAQKEICAYYGIQFVDMLHESAVNRLNAWSMLPDGIHPTPACHRLLGIELARKLL